MIRSIGTPVLLTRESDLRRRIQLLEKGLKGKFPMGIEVVGGLANYTNPESFRAMVENAKLARDMGVEFIAVHAPVTRDNYKNAPTNLTNPDMVALGRVVSLAEAIGADLLNFHAEVFMREEKIVQLASKFPIFKSVAKTLKKMKKWGHNIPMALENMPVPLMGDVFRSGVDMVYDPVFSNLDELCLFAIVNNLLITFDTCHWGTTVESGQGILEVFQAIEDRAKYLHFSDVRGEWVDGVSLFEEGVVPGEGKLGEHLGELARYMNKSAKGFSLSLEVNDKDFQELKESQRGLQKLMEWLA